MDTKIWLITGCSRGIGKVLALAVLEKGHRVAATAREIESLSELTGKFPENCLPLHLNMNSEKEIGNCVESVLKKWGRIDVLVNNAGYGVQGMIEEVAMQQIRMQLETNFFGLAALTQKVIAGMRENRSGYIVNVSSVAGLRGSAGFGIYNASKFAVEGFSEALAIEMKPFGIRVSLVEPGPYKTDWAGSSLQRSEAMVNLDPTSPYFLENKKYKDFLDANSGKQPGDPQQIASVLIEAADHPAPPLHMVFGDIAIKVWKERLELFKNNSFFNFYPNDKFTL